MKIKKLLTFVLCAALIFSVSSFNVFASEGEEICGTIAGSLMNVENPEETYISIDLRNINAKESIEVKLYDSNNKLLATMEATEKVFSDISMPVGELSGKLTITADSSYWKTTWEKGKLNEKYVPSYSVLYIDGQEMNSANVNMSQTNGEQSINWKDIPGVIAIPETIGDIDALKAFALAVNSGYTYKGETVTLESDINLSGEEWEPIGGGVYSTYTGADGKTKTIYNIFEGTFDGNNHKIENLKITKPGKSNIGFFGHTQSGSVKNLTIVNADIEGRLNVGVVAGTPYTSKYTNITVKGHVEVDGMSYVGGVGGKNAYTDWTNITVDVDDTSYVNANSVENEKAYRTYVGGVIGFMGEGGHKVSNVYSNIDVIGSTCDVGGITGIAHYGNTFENCVSTGDVTITGYTDDSNKLEIGGIAGVWHNQTGYKVTFINCKYSGTLSCTSTEGTIFTEFENNGLVGKKYNSDGTGELIIINYSWSTATDAGYYMSGEDKIGMMRYLFFAEVEGNIEDAGIKFVSGVDLTSEIVGELSNGEEIIDGSGFYGDINNIPEANYADEAYYAVAYVTTDKDTFWSDPVPCTPDFTKHFFTMDK